MSDNRPRHPERFTQINEEKRQHNNDLYSENSRLAEADSSLAAENKSLGYTYAGIIDGSE